MHLSLDCDNWTITFRINNQKLATFKLLRNKKYYPAISMLSHVGYEFKLLWFINIICVCAWFISFYIYCLELNRVETNKNLNWWTNIICDKNNEEKTKQEKHDYNHCLFINFKIIEIVILNEVQIHINIHKKETKKHTKIPMILSLIKPIISIFSKKKIKTTTDFHI